MKHLVLLVFAFLSLAIVSCKGSQDSRAERADTIAETIGDSSTLVGQWILVSHGKDSMTGFELRIDSTAKSINMTKVLYSGWRLSPGKDTLLIFARGVGNGLAVNDTIVFGYKVAGDTLTLNAPGLKPEVYFRRK